MLDCCKDAETHFFRNDHIGPNHEGVIYLYIRYLFIFIVSDIELAVCEWPTRPVGGSVGKRLMMHELLYVWSENDEGDQEKLQKPISVFSSNFERAEQP